MKLILQRTMCGPECTLGTLSVDGLFQCYALEDTQRGNGDPATVTDWKIKDESAIPKGTYDVIVTYSQRFQRDMPLLVNVPGFAGIRIHSGNTTDDTSGCILVGTTQNKHSVGQSRIAFDVLFTKIMRALEKDEVVSIEIL